MSRSNTRFAATFIAPSLTMLLAISTAAAQSSIAVSRVANGFAQPVFATTAPGDANRMFVIEQSSGDIEIFNPTTGVKNSTPFLRISDLATGGERGLLGLAFHPEYASNGKFYVNLTGPGNDTYIREYQRTNPDTADSNSGNTILTFDQPYTNHNGGWIGFGPDGYLHIATGDGGAANDPGNNSQDITDNLLGKMLRIDVNGDSYPTDSNRDYRIPTTNPFVGKTGDDEILHYGLRNPWRSSFDRETGNLFIGDVGQNVREEIDVAPAGSSGLNFGWRLREGTIATPASGVGGTAPAGAVDPIYEYNHGNGATDGRSVTGGYVYRGPIAALQGHYFFGDYVTERIWSLKFDGSAPSEFDGSNYTAFTDWTAAIQANGISVDDISSFGEDADGNLYILDRGGEIFRIDAASFVGCDFTNNNGGCEVADLDALYAEFGGTNAAYDFNADGSVDKDDISIWLEQASAANNPSKGNSSHLYALGDVNLDGQVDSTDLGRLLNNFPNTDSLGWGGGNLDGDSNVNSTDLGLLLNNFGFVSSVSVVPEPSSSVLSLTVLMVAIAFGRRSQLVSRCVR